MSHDSLFDQCQGLEKRNKEFELQQSEVEKKQKEEMRLREQIERELSEAHSQMAHLRNMQEKEDENRQRLLGLTKQVKMDTFLSQMIDNCFSVSLL